jgi:hypothetical protein
VLRDVQDYAVLNASPAHLTGLLVVPAWPADTCLQCAVVCSFLRMSGRHAARALGRGLRLGRTSGGGVGQEAPQPGQPGAVARCERYGAAARHLEQHLQRRQLQGGRRVAHQRMLQQPCGGFQEEGLQGFRGSCGVR